MNPCCTYSNVFVNIWISSINTSLVAQDLSMGKIVRPEVVEPALDVRHGGANGDEPILPIDYSHTGAIGDEPAAEPRRSIAPPKS